jgi:hypothetical protein
MEDFGGIKEADNEQGRCLFPAQAGIFRGGTARFGVGGGLEFEFFFGNWAEVGAPLFGQLFAEGQEFLFLFRA